MEPSGSDAPRFFLSYRREDSAGHAGRLADHLLDRFGSGSVFVDVDSIEAGVDFTAEIERAIGGADAVLVVIGPGWLDARTSSGTRRLQEPSDFVRREVEVALASEVRVIPVLVGGARMPTEAELPPSIAALARRNAVELQDRRWREDVDALVEVLQGRGRGTLGNLPVQPTPFLGRERELAELTELLRHQDVRVLTLTGPGGTGKTRLAIQVASKLAHTYPGGAWFAALAALTDPDLVLSEVARALEIRDAADDQLVQAIAGRIGGRRTLLVLDNLEQLLPAAATPIAELSGAAASLELIVSSRAPLRITAEREVPVPTLSEDEAVSLFAERARALDPSFALEDDRASVAAICERLDRLPLAIELAAARVRLLSPSALLRRLEQRLPLLTAGAHDAPERQRTLRATIAWSTELLDEAQRRAFARLAVFSGGWTLDAAETVCDADLDTMQSLVERSLIRQERGASGEPRFSMLETIREFALELTDGSDVDRLSRRHAEHFLSIAESAHRGFETDQRSWIARIGDEYDNLRGALQWSLDADETEAALGLALGLSVLWYARGPVAEGRRWLREVLDRSTGGATEARAWALNWAGFLAAEQGEPGEGAALLTESIACAREAEALAPLAISLSQLAGLLPEADAGDAVPIAEEAVSTARASGEDWVIGIALNNLGDTYLETGDTTAAIAALEESASMRYRSGGEALKAIPLLNLAEIALMRDEVDVARERATEALGYAEALGNRRYIGFARGELGWCSLADGNVEDAVAYFRSSLELMEDLGYNNAIADILFGMAGSAAAAGDVERAARLASAAARSQEALGLGLSAVDSGIHRRYIDEARAAADPTEWEEAARQGGDMSFEEAIEYALFG